MIARLYAVRLDETAAAHLAEIRAGTGETISDVLKRGLLALPLDGVKQPVKQEATFPTGREPVKQEIPEIVKQTDPECLTEAERVKQDDAIIRAPLHRAMAEIALREHACHNKECSRFGTQYAPSIVRCPTCRVIL